MIGTVVLVGVAGLACSDATIPENPITSPQVTVGPGNVFSPKNITIAVGDTVYWIFAGGGHDVSFFNPQQPGTPGGCGGFCKRVFTTAGTFNYYCSPHVGLGMVGSVTVQ